MSLTVYGAYKASPEATLEKVVAYAKKLRLHYHQALVQHLVETLKPGWHNRCDAASGMNEVEAWIRNDVRRGLASPFNFTAALTVIPHRGEIYLVFSGLEWKWYLRPEPDDFVVTDYHYQNDTDWPEGISDEEWEARQEVWEEVFSNDDFDSPDSVGLSYDLFAEHHIFPVILEAQGRARLAAGN